MKVGAEAEECVNKSIETKGSQPRIYLDDNLLLKAEKEEFKSVEHFNRFPMLKINDIVYYGRIDNDSIMAFICSHVRNNLTGCKKYVNKLEGSHGNGFAIFVTIVVGIIFIWFFNKCRISLRQRFENEMNMQVDASINKFLAKTGGNAL